jgi:RNA polymerase sigma factor (sigma-70 family)
MDETVSFASWIRRVRCGEADAAVELVRRYERAVRVAVRVRLMDARLRRQFDSMDVCQSVMASFFVRMAAGQFDLQSPQQLVGLLIKMAQNKFMMQARKHSQQKRDVGRDEQAAGDALSVADGGPGPVRVVASRELLSALLDRLTPEERELARRRALGQSWNEIAAELGETAQAVRMRLSRAIDRVSPALGMDDGLDFEV